MSAAAPARGRALEREIGRRRTFAIISHPDAGKTTVTEKLLYLSGAVAFAGTVKARKSQRHATSDWMAIEQQRGISVTSSVMQFEYQNHVLNLLDTPGHEDFSEDTYRTLTAVDSALMVIDAAKGVEDRTIKLLEVCRLRNTPVITFINKLDRHARDPLELLDEIESILKIRCAPVTWPLGSGQHFGGIYHFERDEFVAYEKGAGDAPASTRPTTYGLDDPRCVDRFGDSLDTLREEIELIGGASERFNLGRYRGGEQSPVFFGTALQNFGLRELLDFFVEHGPEPQARITQDDRIEPDDERFSGFVFKIQANMDPQHRDRIAFLRICSGKFEQGMRLRHVRVGREVNVSNAMTFMARERDVAAEAWPGDIIGIHNHGTVQIGDAFTSGHELAFQGIPNFAPELFRRIRPRDPLKSKALTKGLTELCEEGAAQVFKRQSRNELILGAVGVLQFDVVAWRLQNEYKVDCVFEAVQLHTARWVTASDTVELSRFKRQLADNLALDGGNYLAYLAPTAVNLQLTQERWPKLKFHRTREQGLAAE